MVMIIKTNDQDAPAVLSPGAALVARRWAKTLPGSPERAEHGRRLALAGWASGKRPRAKGKA